MQAAVHECLGEAIGQHCRIVGQDASDKEESDSVSTGCANSLWSDSDSDVHADAHEQVQVQQYVLWEPQLIACHVAAVADLLWSTYSAYLLRNEEVQVPYPKLLTLPK